MVIHHDSHDFPGSKPGLEGESEAAPAMTVTEFARLLGVNRDTVQGWAKAGRVPCFKTPGGHYRIKREALDALTHKPS